MEITATHNGNAIEVRINGELVKTLGGKRAERGVAVIVTEWPTLNGESTRTTYEVRGDSAKADAEAVANLRPWFTHRGVRYDRRPANSSVVVAVTR